MRWPEFRGGRTLAVALLLLPLGAGATGTLSGRVTLGGPKRPPPALLDTSSDPACAAEHLYDAAVLLGGRDGRGLANVVVRVRGPRAASPPTSPVKVEQHACSYRPRVQAAVVGQPLEILNADPMLHNVHAYYAGTKGLFNVAQPPGSPAVSKPSPSGPGPVRLTCDIHRWMVAWVMYDESPFFTVTDGEGNFRLEGLPVGSWELELWHESLGRKSFPVEVKEGGQIRMNVEYAPP